MTSKQFLSHSIKFLLSIVVLYFVINQVIENWDQVAAFDWQIDPVQIVVSFVLGLIGFLCFSTSWKMIIGGFGHHLSATSAYRISYLSHLGRYIPGKIWQVFGMLYLAKQEGVPEERTTASFVIFQMFTIPASLLVYVMAAQFEPSIMSEKFALLGSGSARGMLGLLLIGCLLLVIYPAPILSLANRFLRRLNRQPVEFRLDKIVAARIFLTYVIGWILFGLAFWFFLRAVLGESAPSAIAAVGLYNIAYQIGYLALFAPGGFGPREYVMGFLLVPFIGPLGASVAVLARIWSIVLESIAAGLAVLIKR